jgi:hypothetical protein
LNEAKLENAVVKLKGELINLRKGLRTISSIGVDTSKGDFKDLAGQIEDTISYLKNHKKQLGIIKKIAGISFANLNFGLILDVKMFSEKQNKSFSWPGELLKLAGDLGISMELTLYAPAYDDAENISLS